MGIAADRLANSTAMTLISRVAVFITPVVLAVLAWVVSDYIQIGRAQVAVVSDRLDQQESRIAAVEKQITAMDADRNVRIIKAAEAQVELLGHLKTIDADISDLTKAVTTVTVKIDDMRAPPSPASPRP